MATHYQTTRRRGPFERQVATGTEAPAIRRAISSVPSAPYAARKWAERTVSHRRFHSDMHWKVVAFITRNTGAALATRARSFRSRSSRLLCAPKVDRWLVVEVTPLSWGHPPAPCAT